MADIELYNFAVGTNVYRYTNALTPVAYLSQNYQAVAITRSAIEMSTDLEKAQITVTVPLSLTLLDYFRPVAPLQKVLVTILRTQRGAATASTIWSGALANVESNQHTVTLTVQSRFAAQANNGLRQKWQKPCPRVLYNPDCGVSRVAFRANGTLIAVSGRTIRANAFAQKPNGYFVGGYIEWVTNGVTFVAFVIDHTADTLTLLTLPQLSVGSAVSAYPGCDHSTGTGGCGRFNNMVNYGGQPYIPLKNPVGSNKIY
ncbi:MAG: phage BR0599 family protein [Rhodanobacter sp.]